MMKTESKLDTAGAVVLWFMLSQLLVQVGRFIGDWLQYLGMGVAVAGAIATAAWMYPLVGLVLAGPLGICCLFAFDSSDPWFYAAGIPLTGAAAVGLFRAVVLRRLI